MTPPHETAANADADPPPPDLTLPDPGATARLAARVAALARPGDAILLDGPLGAGKSAFARAFLRAASGDPALEVPSPTFTLVQPYPLPADGWAHHFDLYRLQGAGGLDEATLAELGWDEARAGIVLVEWPERLGGLAPPDALRVSLRFDAAGADARLARLRGWPGRLEALGRAVADGPPPAAPPLSAAAEALLRRHGYAGAARDPLPGDAGRRRYARLRGGPRPALLMDCSAEPADDLAPFLALAPHLAGGGLSVPAVLGRDEAAGLLLVEDLGEDTHAALLDAGADPSPLYAAAGAALAALHALPPPPGLPAWDGEAMARAAAATFLDWWWPAALGSPPDAATRADFDRAVRDTAAPFAAATLVHRDWFPANLTRVPGRSGLAAVGVLDFQDAALGHPAYDLVSLVEDARRDVAPAARAAALEAYRDAARAPGGGAAGRGAGPDLPAAMAALGAVRHLRVAALWVRLARRDGKPGYLRHGPRCWRLLAGALSHPAAAPLAAFLDARVPAHLRANPSPEASAA